MNRFRCKLAQVIRGTRAGNDQLQGSGGQRSRSQKAEVIFRGLAETSLSTRFGRVGYLIYIILGFGSMR